MDDRLEQIAHDARAAHELGTAMLAVLEEILTVLRHVHEGIEDLRRSQSAALDDLRDLGRSQSAALLQILDRLGPGPGAAPA
jgi:hypothetical protein